MAAPFDSLKTEVTGPAVPVVVEGVMAIHSATGRPPSTAFHRMARWSMFRAGDAKLRNSRWYG